MKAITPVIALVMLMLVTVGIVGASYTWFGGLVSSSTKKSISIPPGGAYCADGDIKIYALNNGDTTLTASDIIVAQVDGVDIKNTPFFGDMKSGLVGYWKFDEAGGTTAKDSSGNNNNGDLKPACPNCPEWKTGRSRSALNFDGVNDYVDAGNGASLNFGNAQPFTFEAWVKLSGTVNTRQHVIAKGRIGAGPPYTNLAYGFGTLYYSATDQRLEFDIYHSVSSVSALSYVYADGFRFDIGNWHNYAATWDGTTNANGMKLYVDGVFVKGGAAASTNVQTSSANLGIGRDLQYPADTIDGAIDEVKIYNKAAGDVNIQPGASGLVVNYPGTDGKHTIRVGTPSGVAESTVTCK